MLGLRYTISYIEEIYGRVRTFNCIFIGYAQIVLHIRFTCLNDKNINEYRDAEFFEHVFSLKKSLSVPCLSSGMHDLENPSAVNKTHKFEIVNTSNVICELEHRRSKRQRIEKSFGPDFFKYLYSGKP